MAKLIQQGDVLFFRTEEFPTTGLKPEPPDMRGVVFAEGEFTGHFHGTDTSGITLFKNDKGTMFADVRKQKTVHHQEHGDVVLPPGKYRIGIVREVDPFTEEVESVRD